MAALDQTDIVGVFAAKSLFQDVIDPGSGRIDNAARLNLPGISGQPVLKSDLPQFAGTADRDNLCGRIDLRAPVRSIARIQDDQPGIIDPAIGIFERLFEMWLQRLSCRIICKIKRCGAGQLLAAADMIVQKQTDPDQPCGPCILVMRQDKSQRPDDVRGHGPQRFAFHQRFAHEAEFVMFQIAQTAVDEFGRP